MRVAVLHGGRSSEHEVSLASAATVTEGLAAAGHEPVAVLLARAGTWQGPDGGALTLAPGAGLLGADVAFPVLHGPYGEDGTVQGLLELLDLPYVGAGVLASALCMDKAIFKDVLAAAGVPQVDYAVLRASDWEAAPEAALAALAPLGWPLFVKPARLGSSVGISKVARRAGLADALATAFSYDPVAVVEAFSGGIEVECAVIGNRAAQASAPGEVVLLGDAEWYDYEAKYSAGGVRLQIPAGISDAAAATVRRLAVETFQRTGCAGLARVDFFVEGERVLVNELNTLPGMTATSAFPKLWEAAGLPWPQVCDRLVRLALED